MLFFDYCYSFCVVCVCSLTTAIVFCVVCVCSLTTAIVSV